MQPLTLPREILHTQSQRNTRMLESGKRQGSVRSAVYCGCWRADGRSPVLLVRVSYKNEGSGPVVLDTALFFFFCQSAFQEQREASLFK